jgi:hypothetical protein
VCEPCAGCRKMPRANRLRPERKRRGQMRGTVEPAFLQSKAPGNSKQTGSISYGWPYLLTPFDLFENPGRTESHFFAVGYKRSETCHLMAKTGCEKPTKRNRQGSATGHTGSLPAATAASHCTVQERVVTHRLPA